MDSTINSQTDPVALFHEWLATARSHPQIKEATAMALATVNAQVEPHVRVVLCKEWTVSGGLTFFTNYESRKGQDLEANPKAAGVFYWDPLFRQVKVTGEVEKISRRESEEYWRSRPRESQISQYLSKQSQLLPENVILEEVWASTSQQFANREIPCPAQWGGYRLRPKSIEFWIGRPGRLHDRYQFEKSGSLYTLRRLYP